MLVTSIKRGWKRPTNFSALTEFMRLFYPCMLQEAVMASLKSTRDNYWSTLIVKRGTTKLFYVVRLLKFSSTFELFYLNLKLNSLHMVLNILLTNMGMSVPSALLPVPQRLFNYCVHSSIFQFGVKIRMYPAAIMGKGKVSLHY